MPFSASAPCATVCAWRAKRSKNRSSLGRNARNQRSMNPPLAGRPPQRPLIKVSYTELAAKSPPAAGLEHAHPPICTGKRPKNRVLGEFSHIGCRVGSGVRQETASKQKARAIASED